MNKTLLMAAAVAAVLLLTIPGVLSCSDTDAVDKTDTFTGYELVPTDVPTGNSLSYVTYDADGNAKTNSVSRYNLVNNGDPLDYNDIQLSDGSKPYKEKTWTNYYGGVYFVTGQVTMDSQDILNIEGDITLVFDENATLTFLKRVEITSGSLTICSVDPSKPGTMHTKNITGGLTGDATINIHGVNVEVDTDSTIKNSNLSAGIGSFNGFDGNTTVNIYGGNVTVDAYGGAAIGGSPGTGTATVNIYGGTINATTNMPAGESNVDTGAAIGGGVGPGGTTIVNVTGGNITATSYSSGSGIGGGPKADQPTIVNITGGNITANSGSGAGIGSSTGGYTEVSISGIDTVVRAESDRGAGIGAGANGNTVKVTISGGIVTTDNLGYRNGYSGEMILLIDHGFVYADTVNFPAFTVTGGGALFYKTLAGANTNQAMYDYDLSEVFENLQLYAMAYSNGYLRVIDHVHDTNGEEHFIDGVVDHRHCGVPRYDGTRCYYSPDVSHHHLVPEKYDEQFHVLRCTECNSYELFMAHETGGHAVDIGDDHVNHQFTCTVCGEDVLGPHHYDISYVTSDLRHHVECVDCGDWYESDHEIFFDYDGEDHHDWFCNQCGHSGTMEHRFTYVDNGDGTHTATCYCLRDGQPYSVVEYHEYVDGVCACGAFHPGLIGGGMDDVLPPAWGYDEHAQDVSGKEKEEWVAIAVAATAAALMAVFLIWDRKR